MSTSVIRKAQLPNKIQNVTATSPWKSGWREQAVYWISERAYLLNTEGRFVEALTLLKGLAALDPSNLYNKDSISALHLALGNWAEAEQYAGQVLRAEPGNVSALVRRCEAFLHQGKLAEAKEDLNEMRDAGAFAQARRMEMRLSALRQSAEIFLEGPQKNTPQHATPRLPQR